MTRRRHAPGSRTRAAFTLLELLVVVSILAVLAGLVITKIDFVRRQADMAAAADTTAELSRNIQMYVTVKGVLPDGMDSLLDSANTAQISKWIYDSSPSLVPDLATPANGNTAISVLGTSGADRRLNSLGRMGVLTLMDLSDSATFASDAGTVPRSIDRKLAGVDAHVLVVRPGSSIWNQVFPPAVYGTPSPGETESMFMPAADIVAAVGDGSTDQVRNISFGINTTVSLVVLGIGRGNSMNGITMSGPPIYPAPDPESRYYRYVALVAVYGDGRRAQFKAALDPFGRTNAAELAEFTNAKPN